MDILLFSLNATLPVILCMALGVFLRQNHTLDDAVLGTLNKLCFQVFLPCLTFYNTYTIDFSIDFSMAYVTFALVGILLVAAVLALIMGLVFRDREWLAATVHVGFRSNYVMYAIPLAINMFGDEGARIASMLIPVAVIPFNVITLILFGIAGSYKGDSAGKVIKRTALQLIKNPLIIASALGLIMSLSGLTLPGWATTTVKNLSGVASPLCLITLGARVSLKDFRTGALRVWMLSFTRLIFVPLATTTIAVLAGFRGAYLGGLFVLFASPCANSCLIMAQQYNIKPAFTAQVVAATTVLSAITTFIGISLLRWLQLF